MNKLLQSFTTKALTFGYTSEEIAAGAKAALLLLKQRNHDGRLTERLVALDESDPSAVLTLAAQIAIEETSPAQLADALKRRLKMIGGDTLAQIEALTPKPYEPCEDDGDTDCFCESCRGPIESDD